MRRSSKMQWLKVSLYWMACPPAPGSSGTKASRKALASLVAPCKVTPLQAMDKMKDAAFSRVRASSARSSNWTSSATPSSALSRVPSCSGRCLTSATRARKALDRSSEPAAAARVCAKNSCIAPRFTPASWMLGLFEKSSAKISKVRARMESFAVSRARSSSGCKQPIFSTLRATSGSSQSRSMTSNVVLMLSSVRSSAMIFWTHSRSTLLGSSILPKASSMAFSKNLRSSSDITWKFEGAVPS
mmetsp:Transcript_101006/g.290626  ORF Transcript_101006/g.290626 Transcript_101006/m.290626 type:complete len:244 (+) Transcript_101006:224-955(+)